MSVMKINCNTKSLMMGVVLLGLSGGLWAGDDITKIQDVQELQQLKKYDTEVDFRSNKQASPDDYKAFYKSPQKEIQKTIGVQKIEPPSLYIKFKAAIGNVFGGFEDSKRIVNNYNAQKAILSVMRDLPTDSDAMKIKRGEKEAVKPKDLLGVLSNTDKTTEKKPAVQQKWTTQEENPAWKSKDPLKYGSAEKELPEQPKLLSEMTDKDWKKIPEPEEQVQKKIDQPSIWKDDIEKGMQATREKAAINKAVSDKKAAENRDKMYQEANDMLEYKRSHNNEEQDQENTPPLKTAKQDRTQLD